MLRVTLASLWESHFPDALALGLALARRGHEVSILTQKKIGLGGSLPSAAVPFLELEQNLPADKLKLKFLPDSSLVFQGWKQPHPMLSDILEGQPLGNDLVVLDSTLLWHFHSFRALRKECRRNKIGLAVLSSDISWRPYLEAQKANIWTIEATDLLALRCSFPSLVITTEHRQVPHIVHVGALSTLEFSVNPSFSVPTTSGGGETGTATTEMDHFLHTVSSRGLPLLLISFGISDSISLFQAQMLLHALAHCYVHERPFAVAWAAKFASPEEQQHFVQTVLPQALQTNKSNDHWPVLYSERLDLRRLLKQPSLHAVIFQGGQKTMFETLLTSATVCPMGVLPLDNDDQFETARVLRDLGCAVTLKQLGWKRLHMSDNFGVGGALLDQIVRPLLSNPQQWESMAQNVACLKESILGEAKNLGSSFAADCLEQHYDLQQR